tara:strand:- start:1320 stop:1568 length:249 start_codon:yes stop_codon:yes gene_type:complete
MPPKSSATGQKDRIKKHGKQKLKIVKPNEIQYGDPDTMLVFKIHKGVEDDKKIKPKDVFEGYSEKGKKSKKSTEKSSTFRKK